MARHRAAADQPVPTNSLERQIRLLYADADAAMRADALKVARGALTPAQALPRLRARLRALRGNVARLEARLFPAVAQAGAARVGAAVSLRDAGSMARQVAVRSTQRRILRLETVERQLVSFFSGLDAIPLAVRYGSDQDLAIALDSATTIPYANGQHHSLTEYGDMATTTATRAAENVGAYEAMLRGSVPLVTVSAHGTVCSYCYPWEGRTFAMTLAGAQMGYPMLPASPPWHPHCRHYLVPGIGAGVAPDPWSLTASSKERYQYAKEHYPGILKAHAAEARFAQRQRSSRIATLKSALQRGTLTAR